MIALNSLTPKGVDKKQKIFSANTKLNPGQIKYLGLIIEKDDEYELPEPTESNTKETADSSAAGTNSL